MSNQKSLDVTQIIERAKLALGIRTNTELANLLKIKQNTISTWKQRGSMDLSAIIEICDGVSADWLLYGKGTPQGCPVGDIERKVLEMMDGLDNDQKQMIAKQVERERFIFEMMKRD